MQKTEITKLINQEESETFERKKSLADKDRIAEVICSFANNKGGKILIGVSDKGKVIGVDIGKQTIEGLTDTIIDNTDPKIYPEISAIKAGGKDLIMISVNHNEYKPHTVFGRAFKRVGKNTKPMSQSEYERLLLEKNRHKMQFDAMECKRATLKDISKEKVKEFLATAKRERGLKIDLKISLKEALNKLELLTDKNQLTNAAVLMFAKEPQRFLLQSEIRCAKFKGTKALKPFIDMKVISGNIDEQIDSVEQFIKNNIKKGAWVEEGKMQRTEKWEYPLKALREAVINAICHRDYDTTSNAQVRIFDDRIEIWNPGKLPDGWTVDKLKRKHESRPKNHLIAKLFFLINNIEHWGTGTNEMIEETIRHGLPEPEFEDTKTSIIVAFRQVRKIDLDKLNERQKNIVNYLKENEYIGSKQIRQKHNTAKDTTNRDLTGLMKFNIIKKEGTGRNTRYSLT